MGTETAATATPETSNIVAAFSSFPIVVNGVTFEIKPNRVTKGTAKDTIKYRPDFSKKTMEELVTAWGEKVLRQVQATLQALANGISDEAMEEAGTDEIKFQEVYTRMFLPLSSRGESMKSLLDKRTSLINELTDMLPAKLAGDAQASIRFEEIAKELAELNKDINEKKTKDAPAEVAPAPAVAA